MGASGTSGSEAEMGVQRGGYGGGGGAGSASGAAGSSGTVGGVGEIGATRVLVQRESFAELEFDLIGVDISFANAIRRILLAEVSTLPSPTPPLPGTNCGHREHLGPRPCCISCIPGGWHILEVPVGFDTPHLPKWSDTPYVPWTSSPMGL